MLSFKLLSYRLSLRLSEGVTVTTPLSNGSLTLLHRSKVNAFRCNTTEHVQTSVFAFDETEGGQTTLSGFVQDCKCLHVGYQLKNT